MSGNIAEDILEMDEEEEEENYSVQVENGFFGFGTLITPVASLPFTNSNQIQLKNRANLVGEKVLDLDIQMCEECSKPILIYGRLIPCKHVFCYDCANKSPAECVRCGEEIFKIEKCNLGTIFICHNEHCRRTYLSQRDLEAHIKHRHARKSDVGTVSNMRM